MTDIDDIDKWPIGRRGNDIDIDQAIIISIDINIIDIIIKYYWLLIGKMIYWLLLSDIDNLTDNGIDINVLCESSIVCIIINDDQPSDPLFIDDDIDWPVMIFNQSNQ